MIQTTLFATTPKGIEPLLADELQSLGMSDVKPTRAGVAFCGTLEQAYQVCLWSRLANRVLLPLASFPSQDADSLYEGVATIDWQAHLAPTGTFAVDFTTLNSTITHTHFGALKVKDAIVDQFRSRFQMRPNIALEQPDVRINVHVHRDEAIVSIDLAGDSLHRRGYRTLSTTAPLKENLAAAILYRAHWVDIAKQGGVLLDPMCGSGTLLIEAALMAADIAPSLERRYFGFKGWLLHDKALWNRIYQEAQDRKTVGLSRLPLIIFGSDSDSQAIRITSTHVERAGLQSKIRLEKRPLVQCIAPAPQGLLVTNPPYGERIGDPTVLQQLYTCLGETLKTHFQGWQAAILAGNPELGKQMGLRAHKRHTLYNGALECKLLHFDVTPAWFVDRTPKPVNSQAPVILSDTAHMLANRLRKNLKTLEKWASHEDIYCYRLYDADLPEYAVAIDKYEQWVHVQEYAPPKTIEPAKAQQRLNEALQVICEVLALSPEQLFIKVRSRQKGKTQYTKLDNQQQFYEVREGSAIFLVNFKDYLDTGLFLDQRLTRQRIGQVVSSGKRFLNLFGYTGTATVYAALGGARTTTVDISHNYLLWAQRNLARNGLNSPQHVFVQADCLEWLKQHPGWFDVILLDPPTFSNSKRMAETFDVQRDHVNLIRTVLQYLNPEGLLLFSTNYQRFKLNIQALCDLQITDLTQATIPKDFARRPKIHQCWEIRMTPEAK